MQPVVNRLEADYSNQVEFASLNARTDGADAFDALTLRGHPAIVLFDSNKNEVYRGLGIRDEDELRDELNQLTDDTPDSTDDGQQ